MLKKVGKSQKLKKMENFTYGILSEKSTRLRWQSYPSVNSHSLTCSPKKGEFNFLNVAAENFPDGQVQILKRCLDVFGSVCVVLCSAGGPATETRKTKPSLHFPSLSTYNVTYTCTYRLTIALHLHINIHIHLRIHIYIYIYMYVYIYAYIYIYL